MKKRLSLHDKVFKALKEAVRKVVEGHKRSGRLLVVWRNGKMIWIPAS